MKKLSFDDVLITPQFSFVSSRAMVSTTTSFLGLNIKPIISSNMDSVTSSEMATAMVKSGALGALHRFCTIEENVAMYLASPPETLVSIGLGVAELDRAKTLVAAGAKRVIIDIAHGASIGMVNQVKALRALYGNSIYIIAGNFATAQSIADFKHYLEDNTVDAFKISVGSGAGCLTRVVTGCGWPALASLLDIKEYNNKLFSSSFIDQSTVIREPLILDGGIRTSGDYAKALAAGATAIMCGQLLAGSDESPGPLLDANNPHLNTISGTLLTYSGQELVKRYRGSASLESYEVQGKVATHRAPEGGSFYVVYSGPVEKTLQNMDAGLRSALSYVGAFSVTDFQERAELIEITGAGVVESGLHGAK